MDGVTAIANILRMEGVDFIGCVPYQPLLEAAAIAGIRPIIFRQEGTGIHMVDGYSRVTNGQRIGVFMMQNGPGAENGFGGVAQAYAESVPILLLPAGMARTGVASTPIFTRRAVMSRSRNGARKSTWSNGCRNSCGAPLPSCAVAARDQCCWKSRKMWPWVNSVPSRSTTPRRRACARPVTRRPSSAAARALLAAQRPIIHAGQGVLYAEATDELVQIAEFLQAPVMTTLPGKSAFPENHPLAVGASGPSTTLGVHRFLMRADAGVWRWL